MNELPLQYSLYKITTGSYQGEGDYKTFSWENQLKSVSRFLGKRKKTDWLQN